MSGAIDNTEIGKIKQELNTSIEEYNPEKNSGTCTYFLFFCIPIRIGSSCKVHIF